MGGRVELDHGNSGVTEQPPGFLSLALFDRGLGGYGRPGTRNGKPAQRLLVDNGQGADSDTHRILKSAERSGGHAQDGCSSYVDEGGGS